MIDAAKITKVNVSKILKTYQAILIPGGFGSRGIEGMITACKYARENKIPYFGICLVCKLQLLNFQEIF